MEDGNISDCEIDDLLDEKSLSFIDDLTNSVEDTSTLSYESSSDGLRGW